MNTTQDKAVTCGLVTCGLVTRDLELKVGTRIRLMRSVERYPFFIAPLGAKGTVVSWDKNGIAIKMDDKLESCEQWDNCILWDNDEESFAIFCDDIQMIQD